MYVFRYEKQEPCPVYISKEKFNDMLLLVTKGKETKHANRKHFCMHCFSYEKVLINHKNCSTITGAKTINCLRLMIWYTSKTTKRD